MVFAQFGTRYGGHGLVLTVKTHGFRTIWNSSRRSRARFDLKHMWFSHNLELVADATEVVASSAAQGLPSTRAGGQDDVSSN